MISSLELENFKGIAARQRIDFAPLTLLFGANSAGKSTVLQALLYLHELLERGDADVDRTELGGNVVELGGFGRLVHKHEGNRAIVLRAEFSTPKGLELFGRDLTDFPFPDLDDQVESAWLELTIRNRMTPAFSGPLIERVVIGVGGTADPLVELRTGATLREGEALTVGVNIGHPLLAAVIGAIDEFDQPVTNAAQELIDEWEQIAFSKEILKVLHETQGGDTEQGPAALRWMSGWEFADGSSWMVFGVSRSHFSALPPLGEPLRVVAFNEPNDLVEDADWQARTRGRGYADAFQATLNKLSARDRSVNQVRTFLEMVVLGTTAQLAASLSDALYIGPLRTVPPPGLLFEEEGGVYRSPLQSLALARTKRSFSWADGLAAWGLLLRDRSTLVERTNDWLTRLGANCQVVVHELADMTAIENDLPKGHVEESVRRLLLDTAGSWVLPSEVGAGISQVVPVVVAALEGRAGLTLIEQPEIHIHPAMQVGLGDLFIEASARDGGRRTMLVETHSEHLILRLLRRIRETTSEELPEGAPAFSPDKLSVLYVENGSDGVQIRRLRVDESGEFTDRWPTGFFEERAQELF